MARMASKAPVRKVVAATSGGGVGAAVAEILIYLAESTGTDLPPRIETAITVVVVALFVFGAGYVTPPSADERPIP